MRFIKRIKIIRSFKKVIKKFKKNELKTEDLDNLLKILSKEKNTVVSDDYIKDVDALLYIIKKALNVQSGKWANLSSRELMDRNCYNKMRDIVDELDANTIIHHKVAGIGGELSFEMTYKDKFNKFMYHKMRNINERLKFLKSSSKIGRFANGIIERLDQIIIGIIASIIAGLILSFYILPYFLG
jgi:hypothetical protein